MNKGCGSPHTCLHLAGCGRGAGTLENLLLKNIHTEKSAHDDAPALPRRAHSSSIRRTVGAGMSRTDQNARGNDADSKASVSNDGANDPVLTQQHTSDLSRTPTLPSITAHGCVRFYPKPSTFSDDRDSYSFGLSHHAPFKTLPLPPPSSLPASFSHPRGGGRASATTVHPASLALYDFLNPPRKPARVWTVALLLSPGDRAVHTPPHLLNNTRALTCSVGNRPRAAPSVAHERGVGPTEPTTASDQLKNIPFRLSEGKLKLSKRTTVSLRRASALDMFFYLKPRARAINSSSLSLSPSSNPPPRPLLRLRRAPAPVAKIRAPPPLYGLYLHSTALIYSWAEI